MGVIEKRIQPKLGLILITLAMFCFQAHTCGSGEWANGWGCSTCTAGYRCPGDNIMYACADGQQTRGDGKSVCEPCEANTFSKGPSNHCHACANANNYIASAGGVCTYECPSGEAPNATRTGCEVTECQAGTYNNSVSCTDCGSGQYQDEIGATTCKSCPMGTHHTIAQATSVSQCGNCPAGRTSNAARTGCVNCAAGQYSNAGGECIDCSSGYYSSSERSSSCAHCSENHYTNSNSGAFACSGCSSGTYSPAGSVFSSSCTPQCGDGLKVSSEACDDGTLGIDDGCDDTTCTVKVGWQCSGGSPTSPSTCNPICGDGLRVVGKEACDDGTLGAGDGCDDSSCTERVGWSCSGGDLSNPSTCEPICGDGKKVIGQEECDDGNPTSGDGCDNNCQIEPYYECNGGDINNPDVCQIDCGDGFRHEPEEACDDSNSLPGDGCSNTCQVEDKWECNGGNLFNPDICTDICGDGIKIVDTGSNCDDGGFEPNDGCDENCAIEYGWECYGGTPTSSDNCIVPCGDGLVQPDHEECDDKNQQSGDGCSSTCKYEPGFDCYYNTTLEKTVCEEIKGDGLNMGINECDDGNLIDGDGCSANGDIETGFDCSGGSPTKADRCKERCGDGLDMGTLDCEVDLVLTPKGCDQCEYEKCYECKGGNGAVLDTCAILKIKPTVSEMSNSNSFTISFENPMNLINISTDDIEVKVESKYRSLSYSWEAEYKDDQTMFIQINPVSALEGSENVTVNFFEYKRVRGRHGGCVEPEIISIQAVSTNLAAEKATESASAYSKYSTFIGIGITALLVLIGGGSLEMIWALVNTLQIISFLPLITTYFPQHVRTMYEILEFANMEFDFLTDMFHSLISFTSNSTKEYSDFFTLNGFESAMFLDNCGSLLMTLIGWVSLFITVLLLRLISCCSSCTNVLKKIISAFTFGLFIRFFVEGYLEMAFGSMLNLMSFKENYMGFTTLEYVSTGASAVFLLFLVAFPMLSFALIYDNRKILMKNHDPYLKKFGSFYEEMKNDKEWCHLQFYTVFLARRLLLAVVFVLLSGYQKIQVNLFITSSLLVFCFVALLKPFKNTIDNVLIILNELILVSIALLQTIFMLEGQKMLNITGWVMIGCCSLNILLNFLICTVYNIGSRIKKCFKTNRVSNENQVENLRPFQANQNNTQRREETKHDTTLMTSQVSQMTLNRGTGVARSQLEW